MVKKLIKLCIFSGLFTGISLLEAQNLSESQSLYVFENKEVENAYYNGGSLSFGLVLYFKDRWPSEEEEQILLNVTQKSGLQKAYIAEAPFWGWAFSWPYVRLREDSLKVCEKFPQSMYHLIEHCGDYNIPQVD